MNRTAPGSRRRVPGDESRSIVGRPLLVALAVGVALVWLAGPSTAGDVGAQCEASGDCVTEGDGSVFWGLKEGTWSGESVAIGHLEGSTPDGTATWDGGMSTVFVLLSDADQTVDGDWILDGAGTMHLTIPQGEGTVEENLGGDGIFTGTAFDLVMSGAVTSNGTMTVNSGGGTFTTPTGGEPTSISLEVRLTSADCRELVGEWLPPLEELLMGVGWSLVDIDGFFYAYYLGDEPSEELLAEIDRLVRDADAWGAALTDGGAFDGATADDLVERAIAILNDPDLLQCLFDNPLTGDDPAEFMLNFLGTMVGDVALALQSHEFGGPDLYAMSSLLLRLGANSPDSRFAASGSAAVAGIQLQAQRIISANMVSQGEGCEPCLSGDGREVLGAALAGRSLDSLSEYEIEGSTYFVVEVIQALDLEEIALQ